LLSRAAASAFAVGLAMRSADLVRMQCLTVSGEVPYSAELVANGLSVEAIVLIEQAGKTHLESADLDLWSKDARPSGSISKLAAASNAGVEIHDTLRQNGELLKVGTQRLSASSVASGLRA
jgi:hypothetical protein